MTLALDTVITMIILIVVALVIIGMMIFFSNDIRSYIDRWIHKPSPKTQVAEAKSFPTSQVMNYIRACWDSTGVDFHEDTICYILKGDVNGVDPAMLVNAVGSPAQVDASRFDPTKNTTIISFEDVGNIIKVES